MYHQDINRWGGPVPRRPTGTFFTACTGAYHEAPSAFFLLSSSCGKHETPLAIVYQTYRGAAAWWMQGRALSSWELSGIGWRVCDADGLQDDEFTAYRILLL